MYKFSVIIPVYNRPDEVATLLESLTQQTLKDFEVIVVEDGSAITCASIISKFQTQLAITYLRKAQNTGPGLTRNNGIEKAGSDFFIFFDSDCIIPPHYLSVVNHYVAHASIEAFGGPDKAHASFTDLQKAINYTMTAFLTTGGIRGHKVILEEFKPRSFNMGFSRKVYEKTKGFGASKAGEDIDLGLRILKAGFCIKLLQDAYVYHARRTDLKHFFKQVYRFGMARVYLTNKHPGSLQIVHLLPSLFVLVILLTVSWSVLAGSLLPMIPLMMVAMAVFGDAFFKNTQLKLAFLSVVAAFVQFIGYGLGFFKAALQRVLFRKIALSEEDHEGYTRGNR